MIMEKAYAKLNLSLAVKGKRSDAYHELETVMVPVESLYDELYFEVSDSSQFELIGSSIEDDIILKTAKLFQEKYNTTGAKIRLVKRIPVEAGLGGGSADSSATLRGLNRLFNLNLSLSELEPLAASLGSDTVFTLHNKAAVCRGRGELLEFIENPFSFNVYIIKPDFGLSTKEVFKHVVYSCDHKGKLINILRGLKENNLELLKENIFNDLLTSLSKYNECVNDILLYFEGLGIDIFMSGSGSAFYTFNDLNLILDKSNIKEKYPFVENHLIKHTVLD